MDEEEEKQEVQEETKGEEQEEAKEIPTTDIVKEAKEAARDIKESLNERKEILDREEKLFREQKAIRELGGNSFAGQKEEKKEETPAEYKDRILRGEV